MTREQFEHAVRAAGGVLGVSELPVIGSQAVHGSIEDELPWEAARYETTARLPVGWPERLVRFETPATRGVTAWSLESHDLWVSKAVAGRETDREFCGALLQRGMVAPDVLRSRLAAIPDVVERVLAVASSWIPS